MADTKHDALDMLQELTELTLLDEADPRSFRVRAYRGAASAIASQATDLGRLSSADLERIEGVGRSTAQKIRELFETGKVEKLEALRGKYPASLVALLRLPGLGPKAVRRLSSELGVQSLDDLRGAIAAQKLRTLAGFGEKSERRLAEAIARLEREGAFEHVPISVALPLARRLSNQLAGLPGVRGVAYCGALRRFCEMVDGIELVVAAAGATEVLDAVERLGVVDQVLARDASSARIVTRRGTRVDVHVVRPEQLGAAMLHFTGSARHCDRLRQRARARGYVLDAQGLRALDGGALVAGESEAEIYAALDLPPIPPVLREGWGEIEAAEAGRLPRAAEVLRGDFHVHTDLSGDGRSSLDAIVSAARRRGYAALAITEHAERTLSGVGREALLEQRRQIHAAQRALGGAMRLLHGVELNIGPRGELDYDADFRRGFDWCIASIHSHLDLDREAQTRRVIAAMQDPSVRMIGHLTTRIIGRRAPLQFDLPAVLDAARTSGTALELNGALPRLDPPADILRAAHDRGVTFVLTSDAHHERELSLIAHAASYAHRAHLPPECIANAWDPNRMLSWLARA